MCLDQLADNELYGFIKIWGFLDKLIVCTFDPLNSVGARAPRVPSTCSHAHCCDDLSVSHRGLVIAVHTYIL